MLPWDVRIEGWNPRTAMHEETLFAVANGYLGTRGTMEENPGNRPNSCEGTYLNGVYSNEKITYGEVAYGYATHNQKLLQVPNGKSIQIIVDNETVDIQNALSCTRELSLRSAILSRSMEWQSSTGKKLRITTERFVSQTESNLLCTRIKIEALNFNGKVKVRSLLDASYGFSPNPDDPRVGQLNMAESLKLINASIEENRASMLHQVNHSHFQVSSIIDHQLPTGMYLLNPVQTEKQVGFEYEIELVQAQPVELIKYASYQHNTDGLCDNLQQYNKSLLSQAAQLGWDKLKALHCKELEKFWHKSDVEIEGDPALQQGIRFNLLHLYMSSGHNGTSNIAAKGLTGHGYDGHYFWDSEVYVMPFLLATNPEIAREFLAFRFNTLDGARNRARQMSHAKGALYPWRTIGGDECSAYYPAGTAQYHINSAVAHAIKSYYNATGDWQFMQQQGAEMLFETARLWLQLGHFSDSHKGQFCIDMVTGPDEYTALVNNNFYTNAMAQAHLEFALRIATEFKQNAAEAFASLSERIELTEAELASWEQAASNMYLGYDDKLGINPQDDTFLAKQKWDFENTPQEHYPLLLHYHPLVIYRYQVLKQADVVLAMYMLDDKFDKDLKARNLAYYEPLTTHDSTLSSCIHSIEYAETGDLKRAYDFYHNTVRMDLDNLHGNTEHGVHTACMAGSWKGIVHGFGGVRYRANELYSSPLLPAGWQGYSFNLQYQGRHIKVSVNARATEYQLIKGAPISINHAGKVCELSSQHLVSIAS
nr:glycosyl hydrolase family 65 protein [Neptunicella marina]